MELSVQVKKSPNAKYADLLKQYSSIERSVYSSDISPRNKALRSLALPGGLAMALVAWALKGESPIVLATGLLAVILLITVIAWFISKPDDQQRKTKKS